MEKFKRFAQKNKLKIVSVFMLGLVGGFSAEPTLIAGISSLVAVAAMAIVLNLIDEWRKFEKKDINGTNV